MLLNLSELRLVGHKFSRLHPVQGFDFAKGVSNTPSNPQECINVIQNCIHETVLDYLSFFLDFDSSSQFEALLKWLDDYFATETIHFIDKPFCDGHNTFWHTAESVNGIKIRYSAPGEDGYPIRGMAHFTFSGRPLGELTEPEKIHLLAYLYENYEVRFCRADIANDMPRAYGLTLMSKITDAIECKNYKGFRKSRFVKSDDGWTIYCGKRSSDKMTRFYDKYAESKGEFDCVRHEIEFKHECAAELIRHSILMLKATGSINEVVKHWRSLLIGQISFIDKSYDPSAKNVSRCPALWWWTQYIYFVDAAPIKMSVPRKRTSFPDKVAWMLRSWSTSIAQFEKVYGYERLLSLIDELKKIGNEKMTAFHRAEIRVQISQNNDLNRSFYSNLQPSFLSTGLNEAYRRLLLGG